jgi:hypothetical protein
VQLPAKTGETVVTFNWHQEVQGEPFRLSNLLVAGVRGGGANRATHCPPGYTSSAGAVRTPCAAACVCVCGPDR